MFGYRTKFSSDSRIDGELNSLISLGGSLPPPSCQRPEKTLSYYEVVYLHHFQKGNAMRSLLLVLLLLALGSLVFGQQSGLPVDKPAPEKKLESPQSPIDVYRSYLNAIRKDDLAGATKCWCISGDDNCGALDVIAGDVGRFSPIQ